MKLHLQAADSDKYGPNDITDHSLASSVCKS